MTDWALILKKIAPDGRKNIIDGLAQAMPQVIQIANLITPQRQAQFLAQIAHESDGLRATTEYASGKEYNGRVDLGNRPGTNDGVTYKGRGLIQLTGRSNYGLMSKKLGVDLINNPNLAAKFPYAALTAAYFWKDRNLNPLADIGDIDAITRRINGGYNGLKERKMYLARAKNELSDIKIAQRRLKDLSYPPGGIDGDMGPLTRSALRDFQEANNLPVTGELTPETKAVLFSDSALPRPVEIGRAVLTVADLREKGSKTIEAADEVKNSSIGAGLATAAGVTTSAGTIASNITQISDSAKKGEPFLQMAREYWPVFVIIASLVAITYFTWRAYKSAKKVEEERVRVARTGENVRI
jgi:predicted chitinase